MKFNCTIQMDNDAFMGIDEGAHPTLEVARILHGLADNMCQSYPDDTSWDGYLRDINGNKVGYYKYESDIDVEECD